MSDVALISAAAVPMVCGVLAVGLLQRTPPAHLPPPPHVAQAGAAKQGPLAEKPWVGVIVAGYTAELAAESEGRVAEVYARTGARVAMGDPIVQLDPAELSTAFGMADAELRQRHSESSRAEARLEAAKTKLARLREGEEWLSHQEMDSAQAEVKVAEAELRASRASVGVGQAQVNQQRLKVARGTLVAPFSGTVVSLDVDPGDSVLAGQVILRVLSDDRQVRFAFPASERRIAPGSAVRVTLPGAEREVRASVSAIRPELDPSAELVFATALLPEKVPDGARFLPGASVEVRRAEPAKAGAR
ncbi:MAG TPA: efflux RND transporter periplasmic adaptor subunit [Polyangiaceae bacterium]|nr:efflux RND transporter periplasmic adaptor subunit [Polyangiaceae bacterium]